MKETNIYAVNPLADQLQLYYQILHGNPLFINKYWVQRTTATGIAENLFGVSQSLGTKTGFILDVLISLYVLFHVRKLLQVQEILFYLVYY